MVIKYWLPLAASETSEVCLTKLDKMVDKLKMSTVSLWLMRPGAKAYMGELAFDRSREGQDEPGMIGRARRDPLRVRE